MDFPWPELVVGGPLLIFCGLLVWAVVKLAPTYQKIRANSDATKQQLASAMALVASAVSDANKLRVQESKALTHLAEILQGVASEQRKALDTVRIMQRVQADSSDRLSDAVTTLTERVGALERIREDGRRKTIRTPTP